MTETYNPTKTPLTPRETELIVIAMQCLENADFKINYEKFAKMAEYGNKKSATTVLSSLIKHKIASSSVDSFSVPSSAGHGAGSGTPKKRKATKVVTEAEENKDGNGKGEMVEGSPKKRAPKGPVDGSSKKGAKKNDGGKVKVEKEQEEDVAEDADTKQEGEEGFFEAAIESHLDTKEV
ncbi:hypothetical protein XANCAGTX0491_002490 [Xanthoria calcicola]